MQQFVTFGLIALFSLLSGCAHYPKQKEVRQVQNFQSLTVGGLADVYITQSDVEKLEVHASGMPIDDVITQVENGNLLVTTTGIHSGESVQVHIHYASLNHIKTSGSATLTGENQLAAQHLTLVTTDAGDIKHLDVQANRLTVSINHSGNANLLVDVDSANIEMNDSGDLEIRGVARVQRLTSNSSRGSLNNSRLHYKTN